MSQSYTYITREQADRIKLVMSDVDGTLTIDESPEPSTTRMLQTLEQSGISVGLVSGRTLPRLEKIALPLGITGPIIAENGGVAKLNLNDGLIDLGYSRDPVANVFTKLRRLFPGHFVELPDNNDRTIDLSFSSEGINAAEIEPYLGGVQMLDSGYMLHLLPAGVTKGNTLKRLLRKPLHRHLLSNDEVIVFGDSSTDLSLFELFKLSVLIRNPKLPPGEFERLSTFASYHSETTNGDGFNEVCSYILSLRSG